MIPKYIFVFILYTHTILYNIFWIKNKYIQLQNQHIKKKKNFCLFNNLNSYHIFLVAYNLGEINSEIKMYELT